MILGFTEVPLHDLFKGALVNGCDQSVRLKPMYVVETDHVFSKDLGTLVRTKGHPNRRRNWRQDGWVVLNGQRGEGVDIFFCLDKSDGGGQVVIADQRKHVSGTLGASKIRKLAKKARVVPFVSVVCVFSCFPTTQLSREEIPTDCCVVSYSQTKAYHGAMWVHPAASPCINLNSVPISYLKMIFKGTDIDAFCQQIVKKRDKRKFHTMDEVKDFISAKKKKLDVKVKAVELERIVLS